MKALNEASDSSGAYLVPTEFSNRLLALVQAKAVFYPDLDVRQMGSLTRYIPKVTSGTTARWPDELGSITASQPGFGRITLTAKKVAALTEASTEILEDNNVNVANELVEQMGTDIALAIDSEICNGGTYASSTSSVFIGLRETASMNNATDALGNRNSTQADGTAGTLTGDQITIAAPRVAIFEVLADNHDQPDVSYWNPKTVGQLQALTDSTTRPILNMETYGSPLLRDGVIATLMGTQVKTTTQLPTNLNYKSATANATDAIVARSKQFGILGERRGFIWKTDYDINTDVNIYQTTMRLAFAIKYANAYCLIRGIID